MSIGFDDFLYHATIYSIIPQNVDNLVKILIFDKNHVTATVTRIPRIYYTSILYYGDMAG